MKNLKGIWILSINWKWTLRKSFPIYIPVIWSQALHIIITRMFDMHGSSGHQNQIRSHYSVKCSSFIKLNTIVEHGVPFWNKFHKSTATIHTPFRLHHYCQSAVQNQFLHYFCIHIWPCTGPICALIITGVRSTTHKLSASPSDMQHSHTSVKWQ